MEMARQIFAVLTVLALLGAALWVLRRGGVATGRGLRPNRGTKKLESIERLALTPQHSLHLVRIDGRELVVGTHPTGCTLLVENGGKS